MNKKISIIGIGYVGLPMALSLSKKNLIIGFDTNRRRIEELKNGYDSFNDQNKKDILKAKNLKFSFNENDLKDSNFYIITVPTPVNAKKKPDLKPLTKASRIVGKNLSKRSIVIYESTVYPGCTEEICIPILEDCSGLKINKGFFCGYSPERINVGDKKHTLENVKKIVSGSNSYAQKKISNLYSSIIKGGIHKAESIKVAEAAKVIENTQRDLNIALVNELSIIFDKLNINTNQVLNAAATKWNFVSYKPGLVGGHCVGVDPFYLTYKAKKTGYNPKVILSGRRTNDNMSKFVFDKTLQLIKKNNIRINKCKILIMGYSFKENCSDIRNSKVIDLVNFFLKKKIQIKIFDPLVNLSYVKPKHRAIFVDKIEICKKFFDVLILTVPHRIFLKKFSKFFKNIMKKKSFVYDLKYALPKKYSKKTL